MVLLYATFPVNFDPLLVLFQSTESFCVVARILRLLQRIENSIGDDEAHMTLESVVETNHGTPPTGFSIYSSSPTLETYEPTRQRVMGLLPKHCTSYPTSIFAPLLGGPPPSISGGNPFLERILTIYIHTIDIYTSTH